MSFPRYPKYKDSGVEWLGEVPEHWVTARLKHVSAINMGQSPNSEDCNTDGEGLPFLQGNAEFGFRTPSAKQFCSVSRKIAEENDLLFSVRAPVGALNEADQRYGIGRGLCAIKPRIQTSKEFLWWLLISLRPLLDSISTGSTFEAVSVEQIGNVPVIIPSPGEELVNIATFLDHETAKIDTLITEQERLIALLAEKRQAVISQAVTKGLDPNVPMKDSGVEWLGEVPEHWGVSPLKQIIDSIGSGVSVNAIDTPASEGESGVLKTSCVYKGTFEPEENKSVIPEEYPRLSCPVTAGTLIVSRMNTPDLVGAAGLVQESHKNLYLPDRLWQVRLKKDIDPAYIHYWTHTSGYRAQVKIACAGTSSSMQNLSQSDFGDFVLSLPPQVEQEAITNFLCNETTKIDELTTEARRAIDLLKERRSALISAAVTGKIDVRGLVDKEAAA